MSQMDLGHDLIDPLCPSNLPPLGMTATANTDQFHHYPMNGECHSGWLMLCSKPPIDTAQKRTSAQDLRNSGQLSSLPGARGL